MDTTQAVISELLDVTRKMAASPQSDSENFAKLLARRGELMRRLCNAPFDPSDDRIRSISREGEALLATARSGRDALRAQAASLNLLAALCGGMKSTLPKPEAASVLDVSA